SSTTTTRAMLPQPCAPSRPSSASDTSRWPPAPAARPGSNRCSERVRTRLRSKAMAAIDVAGYVTELKDHAVDHGFHLHAERHFVETYSLRQVWEVDLHPEEGCNGPLDLHLTRAAEPRTLLASEHVVAELAADAHPPDHC